MKIIGTAKDNEYICEVSHTELEKFLNQYYNNLKCLKVGDTVDLSRGYDFASEIESNLALTRKFIGSNTKVINAIINGLNVKMALDASDTLKDEKGELK